MTFRAVEVAAVVERLVGQPRVAEVSGPPGIGTVAQTAVLRGAEVPGILAGCLGAVVARRTGAQNLIMIDRNRRLPDSAAVAVFANVCCLHVCRSLAGRIGAIVTTEAVVRDTGMIEISGCPGDRRVAIVTVVAARNMASILAGRRNAVMTGAAAAEHLGVVNREGRCKHVGHVAVFAHLACLNVLRVFPGCIGAIVATRAISRDVDMIKIGRQPGHGRMTVLAVIAAGNMSRIFAGCSYTVVAGAAGSQDLRVVNRVRGREHIGRMAVFANVGGLNMRRVFASRIDAIVATGAIVRDVHVVEIRRQPGDS